MKLAFHPRFSKTDGAPIRLKQREMLVADQWQLAALSAECKSVRVTWSAAGRPASRAEIPFTICEHIYKEIELCRKSPLGRIFRSCCRFHTSKRRCLFRGRVLQA